MVLVVPVCDGPAVAVVVLAPKRFEADVVAGAEVDVALVVAGCENVAPEPPKSGGAGAEAAGCGAEDVWPPNRLLVCAVVALVAPACDVPELCCAPRFWNRLDVVPPVVAEPLDVCCCPPKRFDVVPPAVAELAGACCCPPKRFEVMLPVVPVAADV